MKFSDLKNTLSQKIKAFDIQNMKRNFSVKKHITLSQKQKIEFFDSLYNLINSGIPITNSLSILLFQTKNKNVKILLESILKDVSK